MVNPDNLFFHGTTTELGIKTAILPPLKTGRLSEYNRKKNLDKVFFTKDKNSALIYARKAVKQFGGNPVVYTIYPIGNITPIQTAQGTSVYMSDEAIVIQ